MMKRRILLLVCLSMMLLSATASVHVDTKIPVGSGVKGNTYVLIIGNENYKHEESVPFALNDAEVFALYCEKTLGVPEKNIKCLKDATLNDINHELDWLVSVIGAYDGEAEAIFYYSGHGMPDEDSKEAYLLPVDGYSTSPTSGLSTKLLYERLGEMPSKRTLVFLDACFSGAKRDGSMLSSSRGVAIKTKSVPVKGNMVVFSAAQGNETAYPYKEYQHGMFTYYILDELNKTGGCVTMGELSDYVTKQVRQASILENGKNQTPSIMTEINGDEWRKWKISDAPAKKYETRIASKTHEVSSAKAVAGGTINYVMPTYTIEGAGTGIQGTYLVKISMTAKKPGDVSDQDLLRCAVHGVLFRGFNSSEYRQRQRPMAGSALSEQQYADFYNTFFQQSYQQYGQTLSSSRSVMKTGKEYQISAVVSVMKDQLRKDLTQQGVIKSLNSGF